MNRRHFSVLVPSLFTVAAARAQAPAQAPAPLAGTHYLVLDEPQAAASSGKIEVIEFFSYACPACNAFDPALERWREKLPADVSFRRMPVPFLANAENFQRTFFALESTGMLAQLHSKVFAAVHVERRRLAKPEEIFELVGQAGGDKDKFMAAFNAFGMSASLARAKAATAAYRIDSIPTVAVAGRFETTPSKAGGAEPALAVVDHLIGKARKPA